MTAQGSLGQIIILHGTSGSGKSSTAELFARQSDDFWLLYGIDHFLANTFPAKFGHHGPRAREGIYAHPRDASDPDGTLRWSFGEYGAKSFGVMHDWIAAASRAGCNIVFDHLLMTDPPVIQDLAWKLEGFPALLVTLKPPFEVLERRVAERAMDKKLPVEILGEDAARIIVDRLTRLRPFFYDEIYRNDICDLEIDSDAHSLEEVVALIGARLAEGPGDAFERLRERFPRR
jgi:chloramphenicol 3-O-phosphotransferase